MKIFIKISTLLMLAILLLLPFQRAGAADGTIPGQFFFGQSFTLQNGQTMQGDLVVFGGSATVEQGATLNGNVVVFGGSLTVDGTVIKDAVVFGGSAFLGGSSHIFGNLSTLGSTLNRTDGSMVDGQVSNGNLHLGDGQNGTPVPPVIPVIPALNINFDPMTILQPFIDAFFLAVLAMLVMFFLAPQAGKVAHAIINMPVTAGGLGLLTMVALPVVYIILAVLSLLIVTLIVTVPLMIAVAMVVGVAGVFGWIAIGYEVGQRFTQIIHQEWHPAFSAGLGVFVVTLIAFGASSLNFIPGMACITWILPSLIGMFALGGVILTRFGTQKVTPPVKTITTLPPADANRA